MSCSKPFLIAVAMLALILLSCIETRQAARESMNTSEPGSNKSTTTTLDMWYMSVLSKTWSVLHTKIGASSMLPKTMFGWQIGSGVKRAMTPKPENPNSQTPAVTTTTTTAQTKTSSTTPPSSNSAPPQKETTSPTPPTTTSSSITAPPQPKKTSETPSNEATETTTEKKTKPPNHDPNAEKMDPSVKSTMAVSAKTAPLVSTTSN